MKKLKKYSNKKGKFTIVIIYGAFAVGKYTVASVFQKITGYKLFHNHDVYDLSRKFVERGSLEIDRFNENLRLALFKEIALSHINVVATHAYSANYVSRTGLGDASYMKKIELIITKAGGSAYFVHLIAAPDTLLKRVVGGSRKKFLKLSNLKVYKDILADKRKDWKTSAPVKNNLVIDNTNISAEKVASMIIKHFNLNK